MRSVTHRGPAPCPTPVSCQIETGGAAILTCTGCMPAVVAELWDDGVRPALREPDTPGRCGDTVTTGWAVAA